MKAKNGANFKRYYDGDTSLWEGAGARHRSQSEADFTLVLMFLHWTNKDVAQVEQLFRQSGLMRPKGDSKKDNRQIFSNYQVFYRGRNRIYSA